jgi:hypothetical protein
VRRPKGPALRWRGSACAARELGGGKTILGLAGARPPMRTHLPESQNRPSRAPRAHSPCWITLNPGRVPFWPTRGARRNLRMRFRLIRAVSTRLAHESCIDLAFCAQPCWRLRGWRCALEGERKVLRPDRVSTAEARSPSADRLVSRTQCK